MTKEVIDWIIKADIGIVIAFLGLMITVYQLHKQQQKEAKEEAHKRNCEAKEAVRQRQLMEQQLRLQAQAIQNQAQQLEQLQNIISQLTFSRFNQ